ncbi:hypothetical protein [Radiobacillus sp. PE A8.2]|uniref:hypothetical protein n=1 Tax=Radiobacillus sp. PE A8.2 TaxID=3380349 RepID=UPI0038907EDB
MKQEEIKNALLSADRDRYSLLFSSKQERDEWLKKTKSNPSFDPKLDEIKNEIELCLAKPIEEIKYGVFKLFHENGSRLEYERIYFAKRRRLTTIGLAALLYPENEIYKEELQEVIWSICNEYSWCLPAHLKNSPEMSVDVNYTLHREHISYTIDLFSAETAFALSEILQVTGGTLDPLIQKRVREEIYLRVIWPYIHQSGYEWETAEHNWAAVCAGSIGATALHLIEDNEELSAVLEKVLVTMEYYLKGFNDDGTCTEGYSYWEYGFGFYVYFADLLIKKTNGNIDLFNANKVHEIALFQQKCFLDKNKVVNFSDAEATSSVFLGLSHYLAKIYSDFDIPESNLGARITEDHCSRWAPALRSLLWFDEKAEGKPWNDATYYFEESQWFVSRHTSNNGRFSFAAKGGHNDEPHNHNDIGQFILYGNDKTYLKDLGSGEYTAGYFAEERYSYLCNSSEGHSVPIINRQFQSEGATNSATIQSVSTGSKVESFEMEYSRAYTMENLQQLVRKFTWNKLDFPSLILEDRYTFTKYPESITERLITPVLAVEENEEGIVLDEKLLIKFDRNQLQFRKEKIEFSNHAGDLEENIALNFDVKYVEKDCVITFVFQFLD